MTARPPTSIRHRRRRSSAGSIAPFVAVEWLQPQIFPLYAGNGLVAAPILAQTADLGGPLLLTALLLGANLIVFETWRWMEGDRPAPTVVWTVGAGVALAAIGYGALRMRVLDDATARAPAVRVGVVQANLDVRAKDRLGVLAHREHLAQSRELLASSE